MWWYEHYQCCRIWVHDWHNRLWNFNFTFSAFFSNSGELWNLTDQSVYNTFRSSTHKNTQNQRSRIIYTGLIPKSMVMTYSYTTLKVNYSHVLGSNNRIVHRKTQSVWWNAPLASAHCALMPSSTDSFLLRDCSGTPPPRISHPILVPVPPSTSTPSWSMFSFVLL